MSRCELCVHDIEKELYKHVKSLVNLELLSLANSEKLAFLCSAYVLKRHNASDMQSIINSFQVDHTTRKICVFVEEAASWWCCGVADNIDRLRSYSHDNEVSKLIKVEVILTPLIETLQTIEFLLDMFQIRRDQVMSTLINI